ncbi:BZIP domain-containing protein [Mycena kentingensis (nom. inval.)]|nr:BZIP domain-containing protein [Mycena kentingensis (nom. inval.)]
MLVVASPPLFTSFTSSIYEQELDLGAGYRAHRHPFSGLSRRPKLAPSTPSLLRGSGAREFRQRESGGGGLLPLHELPAATQRLAPSVHFPDLDSDDGSHPSPRSVVPVKVGMRGTARKVTVARGGVVKRYAYAPIPGSLLRKENARATTFPASSSKLQPPSASFLPNDDDDELPAEWRPSPEIIAKMSSKEKRQLRNKISARNFRVRRKSASKVHLHLEEDHTQRNALVDSVNAQLATAQKENRALRAEIVALKRKLFDHPHPKMQFNIGLATILSLLTVHGALAAPGPSKVESQLTKRVCCDDSDGFFLCFFGCNLSCIDPGTQGVDQSCSEDCSNDCLDTCAPGATSLCPPSK